MKKFLLLFALVASSLVGQTIPGLLAQIVPGNTYVRKSGDTMTGNLTFADTGEGINFFGGGSIAGQTSNIRFLITGGFPVYHFSNATYGGFYNSASASSAGFFFDSTNAYVSVSGGIVAKFAVTTGNLLLGGLTTDGTGRIQLPSGGTTAGGINLGGGEVYLHRLSSQSWSWDTNAATFSETYRANGTSYALLSNNGDDIRIDSSRGQFIIRTNGTTTAATWDTAQRFIPASTVRLKGYTVATLPGSPSAGDTAHVTDASLALTVGIGSVVAGGGANVVPVFYDGTNWRIY